MQFINPGIHIWRTHPSIPAFLPTRPVPIVDISRIQQKITVIRYNMTLVMSIHLYKRPYQKFEKLLVALRVHSAVNSQEVNSQEEYNGTKSRRFKSTVI